MFGYMDRQMDNFFLAEGSTFFNFGFLHRINWAQSWTKNAMLSATCGHKNWIFMRISVRTTCGQNFSVIQLLLLELLLKKSP